MAGGNSRPATLFWLLPADGSLQVSGPAVQKILPRSQVKVKKRRLSPEGRKAKGESLLRGAPGIEPTWKLHKIQKIEPKEKIFEFFY
jgi:hypothetical protein